jgi:hypothetical protein
VSRDEEIERLRALLCLVVGVLDLEPRAVEERLGASPRFLHRLFNNFIEFRVQHLYAVLEAIDLEPSEFFRLAYPSLPAASTPAAVALRQRLPELSPEAKKLAIERAGHPTRHTPEADPPPRRERASSFVRRAYEPPALPPPVVSAPAPPELFTAGEEPEGDRLAQAMERILRQILSEETADAAS